jgi:Acetyltransferase (GNAT) domain
MVAILEPEEFVQISQHSPQWTIFCEPWWHDAVAPGSVRYVGGRCGKSISVTLAIVERSFGPISGAHRAPYTPWLGFIDCTDQTAKLSTRLGQLEAGMREITTRLLGYKLVSLSSHHSLSYLLPMIWEGFSVHAGYTYRIDGKPDEKTMWADLDGKVRTAIRKSEKLNVRVESSSDIDGFITNHFDVFSRQNISTPVDRARLRTIISAAFDANRAKILTGVDDANRIHASGLYVWDDLCTYYLMGGGDPTLRDSGAMAAVLWKAIAERHTSAFDFEGSMIEPIEKFFRGFGGTPTPYFVTERSFTGAPAAIKLVKSAQRLRPKVFPARPV